MVRVAKKFVDLRNYFPWTERLNEWKNKTRRDWKTSDAWQIKGTSVFRVICKKLRNHNGISDTIGFFFYLNTRDHFHSGYGWNLQPFENYFKYLFHCQMTWSNFRIPRQGMTVRVTRYFYSLFIGKWLIAGREVGMRKSDFSDIVRVLRCKREWKDRESVRNIVGTAAMRFSRGTNVCEESTNTFLFPPQLRMYGKISLSSILLCKLDSSVNRKELH